MYPSSDMVMWVKTLLMRHPFGVRAWWYDRRRPRISSVGVGWNPAGR